MTIFATRNGGHALSVAFSFVCKDEIMLYFRMKFMRYGRALAAALSLFVLFAVPPSCLSAGGAAGVGRACAVLQDTVQAGSAVADTLVVEDDLPWPLNVRRRLELLLQDGMFETSTVGMMVYDLTADSVLFARNERQLMRPASTLKMMVAVAALDRLGSGYEYETSLLHTGGIEGSVLDGDLYCKGGFDPVFDEADLDALVDSVRSLGVDTVRGDMFADVSMKDSDRLGEGWCWDDDNPVLSPLLVSRKDGFMECFRSRLHKAGIYTEGEIRTGRVPRRAHEMCVVRRKLSEILPRMMKNSDNLYSESVFYHLAASSGSQSPATARHGRRVMNRLIEKLGFRPSDYYIADGSGLSLYNYVSPELEVAFLRHAFGDDDIYVPLYQVMPVAGVDGTLDDRMRRGYARGNVHAKTGTVTGVSALAGYCTAANGHTLCFSIINMGIRRASEGRRFQDSVCEALCRP